MDFEKAVEEANSLVTQAIPILVRDPAKGPQLPDYSRVDTSAMDQELYRIQASRDVSNANVELDQQRLSNATAEEKAAIKAKGVAEGEMAFAEKAQADRDAAFFAQYASIFGLTPDDMAATVHKMNVERPLAEASLREIQGMQAVSPLDNPLEWWGNQLKLPSKIAAYNRQADIINTMQDTVDAYISTADKAASFAYKGLPTITAARAKAKADAAAADAAKGAAQADIQLAKTSVDFATKIFATDLAVANATERSTQLEVQQKSQEIQLAIAKIQASDNHANRLLNAAKLLETLAKNEDEMAQRRTIEKVLEKFDTIMGHPTGTTNYQMFRLMSEPQRNNLMAIGAGNLGATPIVGMANWYKAGPGPLASPETSRLMEYIQTKTQDYSGTPAVQALDEKQKPDKINKLVTEDINKDIANASKFNSIFYELSPAKMIASAQISKDSVIGKVLEPLTKQDANVPTDLVIQTIAQSFTNPNDAAQAISDYYKRNMALRNTVMQTGLVGIRLPQEYKVRTKIGPLSSVNLDMTKSEDVLKYLLIQKQRQANELESGIGVMSTIAGPQGSSYKGMNIPTGSTYGE